MQICAECFSDPAITEYIMSNGSVGNCDILHSTTQVIDVMEFADFFLAIVNHFYKSDATGLPLFETVQRDFSLFYSEAVAQTILNFILSKAHSALTPFTTVRHIDELDNDDWNALKNDVKYVNRFILNAEDYNLDLYLEKANREIKEGTILYRARINSKEDNPFSFLEMGCPPKELCSAGRANPQGIPYTYLSEDLDTTLYEVRAILLDSVNIGEFKVKRNLFVFDFEAEISIFDAFNNTFGSDLIGIAKQKKFLDSFRKDMSKPLGRNDSALEYVPTQFVCEYCKSKGIDGIRFRSAMHNTGINIVLFNQKDVECEKVSVVKIDEVLLHGVRA